MVPCRSIRGPFLPLSFWYCASMQLDYVFLPSEIPVPVPTPIVDEHHAVIGLARAELSDWLALIIMQGLDWLVPKFQ